MEKDVLGGYETIGDLLKSKRKEKRLEIRDVFEETRIREHYIVALEENKYNVLPGKTYALGYIRIYAKLLGLPNVEELVSYADQTIESSSDSLINTAVTPKATPSSVSTNTNIQQSNQPNKAPHSSWKKILLIAGLLIIIIAGLIIYFTKKNHSNVEVVKSSEKEFSEITKENNYLVVEKNKDTTQDDVNSNNDNTNTTINNNTTTHTTLPGNNNIASSDKIASKEDGYIVITKWPKETLDREITLEFSEDVWVKIYNSDNTAVYLVRTFRKGQHYTVPGVENLKLDLGNYKGVKFIIDDDTYTIPSKNSRSQVMNNIDLSKANIVDNFDEE